jgi:HK97 family phage major capsid protein
MATIDDLIAGIEVDFETAEKRAKKCGIEMQSILAGVSSEGRQNTSEEEDLRMAELHAARDQYRKDMAGAKKRLEDAKRIKDEDSVIERESRESVPTGAQRVQREQRVKVGQEERTYHRGNDRKGTSFLRDVSRQFLYNDHQAADRLSRHMAEERVERADYLQRAAGDTNTGNWAGLTVPQYLTDMYAPNIAALRPFANICNKHDLPPNGMSVNISRVTTASSVALQASELAAVSATSIDDTLLTENVQTAAGQQTLSRQAIDRGTGIEEVVFDDLFRRYATTLDNTLITQATTGLSAVATATAFTTASPDFMSTTAANSLYGKIQSAASGVEAALLAYGQPTHAIMHSRRWYWIQSKVNSVWPGINAPNIPVQAGGVAVAGGYNDGIRGYLPNGLSVVVDNNIATNSGTATSEDEIYIVPAAECHLWEDPSAPVFIRAEQPSAANLGVLLVLYGYFAYSFRRYSNGMQKVGGTGLTTPTF